MTTEVVSKLKSHLYQRIHKPEDINHVHLSFKKKLTSDLAQSSNSASLPLTSKHNNQQKSACRAFKAKSKSDQLIHQLMII